MDDYCPLRGDGPFNAATAWRDERGSGPLTAPGRTVHNTATNLREQGGLMHSQAGDTARRPRLMRDPPEQNPHQRRQQALGRLGEDVLDVLVLGGGIVGSGVARDAAMRGLRVGLVEQSDFASGTSSRSSHLLHGGLRYLAQGYLRLVHEASMEKRVIHRIAPHLAAPLAFVFPTRPGLGLGKMETQRRRPALRPALRPAQPGQIEHARPTPGPRPAARPDQKRHHRGRPLLRRADQRRAAGDRHPSLGGGPWGDRGEPLSATSTPSFTATSGGAASGMASPAAKSKSAPDRSSTPPVRGRIKSPTAAPGCD